MPTDTLFITYGFFGSFSFGLTGVILKLGVKDQNIFYGILLRVLGSLPFLIVANLLYSPSGFLEVFFDWEVFGLVFATATLLIAIDLLLMGILKKKPVGIIAPLVGVNPIFTTVLLLLTGTAVVTPLIIGLTLLIVVGVFLVTMERTGDQKLTVDREAIGFGLVIALLMGVMLFLEIVVLGYEGVDGFSFSVVKIACLGGIGLVLYPINHTIKDTSYIATRSAVLYLTFAGFVGWALGSLLAYTAFDGGPAAILTPIIGLNPLFAVVISLVLRQENMNRTKLVGILLCVVCSILLVA